MPNITPYNRDRHLRKGSIFDYWSNLSPLTFFDNMLPNMRTDIRETDKHFVVEAELPGFDKEDISVETRGDVLVIRAERRGDHEEKQEGFLRQERHYGSFHREFNLGVNVDTNNINASSRNGVLTVSIPKLQSSKENSRRIPIQ